MRRVFKNYSCVAIAKIVGITLMLGIISGCNDKSIDSDIISMGSEMSKEALIKSKSLDKESYKELADLFLDTSEIDLGREVFIVFGKNKCTYCDMLKDEIKKNDALKAIIKEHFNPYYINISYDKVHTLKDFGDNKSKKSIATENLAKIFGVNSTPLIVFLHKNGRVKYVYPGFSLKLPQMIDDVIARGESMGDYANIDKSLNAI